MNETDDRGSNNRLRIIGGLLLITLGVVLLITNGFYWTALAALWPVIIFAIGATFFVVMVVRGPEAGALAIPGSILAFLGVLLFLANLNGTWFNMSYLWPLFVFGGIGIGLLIDSWWSSKLELKRAGYTMLMLAIIFFVAFGTFFSALFGEGNAASVFAFLLIIAGVLTLLLRLTNTENLIDRLPPHHGHNTLPGSPMGGH